MKKIFIFFIYFHSCVSQNYFQPYDNKINPYNLINTDPYSSKPHNDEKNKSYIDEEMNAYINGENNPYLDKKPGPYNDRKNKSYIEEIVNPYIDKENNLPSCKTVRSSWISFYDSNPSQDCVFPFVYKDEIYDGCVSIEDSTNLGKAVEGLGTT